MWVFKFAFGVLFFTSILALTCGVSTIFTLYRMEWFDVWRHGAPPIDHLLVVYVPYTVILGSIGWFLGSLIAPNEDTPRGVVRAGSSLEPGA